MEAEALAREIWKLHGSSDECLRMEFADDSWFAGFVGDEDTDPTKKLESACLGEGATLIDALDDLSRQLKAERPKRT